MFISLSEKIVKHYCEKEKSDNYELFVFGINQGFNMLLNILTALVVGLLFNQVIQLIVYMLVYIPLRIYAGGFHAKTPFRCWIISTLTLLLVLAVMKYVHLKFYIFVAITLLSVVVIVIFSPVEDKNKPLDEFEKKVYKKRCLYVLVSEVVIYILLKFFQINTLSMCFEMVWITLCIMLILGKIKNHFIGK